MIFYLLGSVIAIFFVGKATKEVEEKTENSSWIRTSIYALLSFIVCVFYFKTNQVATIYTMINVTGIRESRDILGNVADTLSSIEIINAFNSPIIDGDKVKAEKINSLGSRLSQGGVFCELRTQNLSPYKIESNFENGYLPGLPWKNGHHYRIEVINTAIPSLLPIYPTYTYKYHNAAKKVNTSMTFSDLTSAKREKLKVWNNPNNSLSESFISSESPFKIGSYWSMVALDSLAIDEVSEPVTIFTSDVTGSMINTLGFFTAADISQYTHALQIKSTCPLKKIEFVYDIPIEIAQFDSCMEVGPMGFCYKGDLVNKEMRNNITLHHVKLPTLANLQLIRSLILTTLATAFLALFFTNLYFSIRKDILNYVKDKQIVVNESGLKKFRFWATILFIILSIITLYIMQLVISANPIILPIAIADNIDYVAIGFAIFILIIIYILFKKTRPLYSQLKKKK